MSKVIITKVELEDDEVLEHTKRKKKRIPIRFIKLGQEKSMDSVKMLTEFTPQEARAFIKLRDNMGHQDN